MTLVDSECEIALEIFEPQLREIVAKYTELNLDRLYNQIITKLKAALEMQGDKQQVEIIEAFSDVYSFFEAVMSNTSGHDNTSFARQVLHLNKNIFADEFRIGPVMGCVYSLIEQSLEKGRK